MEEIKSDGHKIAQESKEQHGSFLAWLRKAFQDYRSHQQQLKSTAIENKLRIQKNSANMREAQARYKTMHQEANDRVKQASIDQKRKLADMRALMRK